LIRKPIRDLHSDQLVPPRVFDVIVDGECVALEVKVDKKKFVTIPWKDVVYQVEAAKNTTNP